MPARPQSCPAPARRLAWGLAVLAVLASGACTEQLELPPGVSAVTGGRGGSGGRRQPSNPGTGGQEPSTGQGGRGGEGPMDASAESSANLRCNWLGGVQQQTPQVMFVLDRSSPMWKRYGTSQLTRLQTVQQVLRSLIRVYRESIHFGYVEYPVRDRPCAQAACCAGEALPPNVRILSALEKRWDCEFQGVACGETTINAPIGAALAEAGFYFQRDSTRPITRHVALLAGSAPSCASNREETECSLPVLEVNRLATMHKVKTHVFGLAEELASNPCFDTMATYGNGMTHRITRTGDELFDELDRWFDVLSVEACTFRLPRPITAPQSLVVHYRERLVKQDPLRDDGWEFDTPEAPTRVTFYGPACDRLRTSPVGETEFSVCSPYN